MFTFSALPHDWDHICQQLLLVVAVLLVGGFAFNRYNDDRHGRMPKRAELPQSALLIVVAVIVWLTGARYTPFATLAVLVCFGIAAGFVGDLLMANVFHQRQHVLFGMAAFSVGHVLYMLAFREIATHFDLNNIGAYGLALAATWTLALVLWLVLIRKPNGGTMQYAALIYALFLASMAGYALGLAFQRSEFAPLAVGTVLFLLSDALIAARLFAGRTFRYMGDVIWTTYIIAQVLIVTVVPVAVSL